MNLKLTSKPFDVLILPSGHKVPLQILHSHWDTAVFPFQSEVVLEGCWMYTLF